MADVRKSRLDGGDVDQLRSALKTTDPSERSRYPGRRPIDQALRAGRTKRMNLESNQTSDPRRISGPAAGLAIAATVAAAILLVTLHLLSPEYSPAWRMVSEYANGHYAWVLSLMFAAWGLSTL